MVDFGFEDLRGAFEAVGFGAVRVERGQSGWPMTSGDEWRRSLDRAPNPLWPPILDLVRDALGSQTDEYLAFMTAGVEAGGYRFSCPTAFLTAVREPGA